MPILFFHVYESLEKPSGMYNDGKQTGGCLEPEVEGSLD